MEDYEGKIEDYVTITCLIRKKQREQLKELERQGKIRDFNMSMFLRKKLDEYLKTKT